MLMAAVQLPSVTAGNINVVIPSFQGLTKSPTDPNNDGKYEDLNGNGATDPLDVVLLFNNMNWIEDNSLTAYFDFNGNHGN